VEALFSFCGYPGFPEQAYDIVVITCLFNFMDRAADAFGVELDPMLLQLARSAPDGESLGEVAAPRRS